MGYSSSNLCTMTGGVLAAGGDLIPGTGVQCKFCKCEFPLEDIKDRACHRCSKNLQKYGKPRACEHCNVAAAFIGLKCQKCSNSIKKYGSPIRCCKCKLKCAFKRPGHDKDRALCLMCMFARQRAKLGNGAGNNSLNKSGADEQTDKVDGKTGDADASMDTSNTSTPNGRPSAPVTPGSNHDNGRIYKVQPRGYFLQTNHVQHIDYNDDGQTSLIGGWGKARRDSLDINPASSTNLASNIGQGTPRRFKHGMSSGDQMVMVLNLQAKIAKLNATLSQKETELMEKEEYWDKKYDEEVVLVKKSEADLVEYQTNEEKRLRDQINGLMGKLDKSKSEIVELKEKERVRKAAARAATLAAKKNSSDADSDKEDGRDKDPDDIKRYGSGSDQDDMDVDEDNRETNMSDGEKQNEDSDEKSDDDSDKENTSKRKASKKKQIQSDDEDDKEDSEINEDGEADSNSNERKKKKGVIFSDSEDDEDKEETKSGNDVGIEKEETSDKNDSESENKKKKKGAIIFSDSEDEDQNETKSEKDASSDKEESDKVNSDKNNIDSEDDEEQRKTNSENVTSDIEDKTDKADSEKNDSDSEKEDIASEKGNASSDEKMSKPAVEEAITENKTATDEDDSDNESSDGDLIPTKKSEKKNGANIFSDSDSDGNSDSD